MIRIRLSILEIALTAMPAIKQRMYNLGLVVELAFLDDGRTMIF